MIHTYANIMRTGLLQVQFLNHTFAIKIMTLSLTL